MERSKLVPTKSNFNSEGEIILNLLKAIEDNEEVTQRSLAKELGIALGLANTYLKRCAKKGFIKILQVPSNRYAYYLTPSGFSEKTRLTAEYLIQSLSLFRQAQHGFTSLLDMCVRNNWHRICLCGVSDLTEITILCAGDYQLEIIAIVDDEYPEATYRDIQVQSDLLAVENSDAYIITRLQGAQELYDSAIACLDPKIVLIPDFLEIQKLQDSVREHSA
jgi:DNA-binding MarR family transcriptional regulator